MSSSNTNAVHHLYVSYRICQQILDKTDADLQRFPKWGGCDGRIKFKNTCPVDVWIVILHSLVSENRLVKDRLSQPDGKHFIEIDNLYMQGKFDEIKSKLIKMNSIGIKNGVADFSGNEFTLFIKHMDFLFKSFQASRCSLRTCSRRVRYIPSTQAIMWIEPSISLEEVIESFIRENGMSTCNAKITAVQDHRY